MPVTLARLPIIVHCKFPPTLKVSPKRTPSCNPLSVAPCASSGVVFNEYKLRGYSVFFIFNHFSTYTIVEDLRRRAQVKDLAA